MKAENNYDNASKGSFTGNRRKQISINIDVDTMAYFQAMSADSGIPIQILISIYLSDCAKNKKQLYMSWK